MDSLTKDQMLSFNQYLDEARELYPEHSEFALQFLCYKLAVDGNVDMTEDPDEIKKIRMKYSN